MIDSSIAVDQSMSNFDHLEENENQIPIIEEKELVYVPDVETN